MRRLKLPGIALGSASVAAAVTVLVLLVTRERDRDDLPAPQANLMKTVVFEPPPCVRIVLALHLADAEAEAQLVAQCTAQR